MLSIIVQREDSYRIMDQGFTVEKGILTKYTGPGGDVVLPTGITRIGKMAFFGSNGRNDINSITLSDGVEYIESWAFFGCASTKIITIPNTVECIEYGGFTGCPKLERIVIPDNPKFEQEDWFGDYFEESSLPQNIRLDEIEPFMDDHAFIREFKKVSLWKKLSQERQANCYLYRRDKRLKDRYRKFIKPKECDQIASKMLMVLPDTISVKEANAVRDYIFDFHEGLSDGLLIQLYERVEKSGRKALVKEISRYKDLGSRITEIKKDNGSE